MIMEVVAAQAGSDLVSNHLQWVRTTGESMGMVAKPDTEWTFTITIRNKSGRRVELVITRRSGDDNEVHTTFQDYFMTIPAAAAYAADEYLNITS